MTDRAIAVIPARGGSKRLPGKHVRSLCGRPAIVYTVEAALSCGLFERVVVTTDDAEIGAVALAAGAEVPFVRAAALADDHTPVSAATVDALERLDPGGTNYRHVAQLMANCPLRNATDIEQSFEEFVRSGAMAQISVTPFGWQNPWWAVRRGPGGELAPVLPASATGRGQDLEALYAPTGAVWWGNTTVVRRSGTFHMPGRTGWVIPWERGIDIDTEEDWRLAEILLEHLRKKEQVHAG